MVSTLSLSHSLSLSLSLSLFYYAAMPASVAQLLDARPTSDQEVAGSTPAEVGNILSWRFGHEIFSTVILSLRWFKKGSCQFLAEECAQYWLTA